MYKTIDTIQPETKH